MCYNRYLYRLPGYAVPITNMIKNKHIGSRYIANPIIGTPLLIITLSCIRTYVELHNDRDIANLPLVL